MTRDEAIALLLADGIGVTSRRTKEEALSILGIPRADILAAEKNEALAQLDEAAARIEAERQAWNARPTTEPARKAD